ncbi:MULTISPECIES: hypothetical protein [Mycolicibacterium]|uniref:hypothetical protein n=1 Tax=Mycolicibacterium TaxID=1866885 RepID=UPI0007E93971|nr:hypothetical protein [Mycolicibacterium fortuitum]OBG24091.1 hypothetical protein A5768_22225 [Mycolicibacterium fortuitum]
MSGDDQKCTPPAAGGAESQAVQVTKADVDAGTATIRASGPKLTAAADQGVQLLAQLTAALGVSIGGEAPIDVPTGGAEVLRAQAAGLNTALSGLGDTLQAWSDTELTVQTDAGTTIKKIVDGASGTASVGATSSGTANVGETDYSKIR